MENLRIIKVKIKDVKAKISKKNKIIEQLRTTSYCSIIINPSRIIGEIDMEEVINLQQCLDDLVVVGYIRPFALCTKGFLNEDVIMAPYGYNYYI